MKARTWWRPVVHITYSDLPEATKRYGSYQYTNKTDAFHEAELLAGSYRKNWRVTDVMADVEPA